MMDHVSRKLRPLVYIKCISSLKGQWIWTPELFSGCWMKVDPSSPREESCKSCNLNKSRTMQQYCFCQLIASVLSTMEQYWASVYDAFYSNNYIICKFPKKHSWKYFPGSFSQRRLNGIVISVRDSWSE